MLEPINLIFIAIGLALIVLEIIIPSFVLIWFGIAALLSALMNGFFVGSDNPLQLIVATSITGLGLLISFRKVLIDTEKIYEINDCYLDVSADGVFHNGKVTFKGTIFEIANKELESTLSENEVVFVNKIQDNKVVISKKEEK